MNITSRCPNTTMTHPAHLHLRGDVGELGVSFNSSSLLFETAIELLLLNGYCTFNPFKSCAERLQAFLKSLYLLK